MEQAPISLRDEIRQAEQDGLLAVIEDKDGYILTDDFEQDRDVRYREGPPSEAAFRELIRTPGTAAARTAPLLDRVVSLLMSLEPDMTRTLRAVWFLDSQASLDTMLKELDMEEWEAPDRIDPGEGALGCFWYTESAVIIDLASIDTSVDRLEAEAERDGWPLDAAAERAIGIYTTLAHEIYHAAEADPFLELPPGEQAAEEYGIRAYEHWMYDKKKG